MTAGSATSGEAGSAASGPVTSEQRLIRRLGEEFPSVDLRYIAQVIEDAAATYGDARIRQYVSIFVERESRKRLREHVIPLQRLPREQMAV